MRPLLTAAGAVGERKWALRKLKVNTMIGGRQGRGSKLGGLKAEGAQTPPAALLAAAHRSFCAAAARQTQTLTHLPPTYARTHTFQRIQHSDTPAHPAQAAATEQRAAAGLQQRAAAARAPLSQRRCPALAARVTAAPTQQQEA